MQTYFILSPDGKYVKIGKSRNVNKRLSALQGSHSHPLLPIGYINGDHERDLHKFFSDAKISGEWFDYKKIKEQINKLHIYPPALIKPTPYSYVKESKFLFESLPIFNYNPFDDFKRSRVEHKSIAPLKDDAVRMIEFIYKHNLEYGEPSIISSTLFCAINCPSNENNTTKYVFYRAAYRLCEAGLMARAKGLGISNFWINRTVFMDRFFMKNYWSAYLFDIPTDISIILTA